MPLQKRLENKQLNSKMLRAIEKNMVEALL